MLLKIHGLMAILVAIDYLLKQWAVAALKGHESIVLIKGLLELTYVENRGAAFGIFSGKQLLLVFISVAIIILLEVYLFKERPTSKFTNLTIALVIAGGIGNLIDRAFQGFVVDYLDINQLFSFPVFNFADICVTVGEFFFIILIVMSEIKDKKAKEAASNNDSLKKDE